jgi:hypothetical protein
MCTVLLPPGDNPTAVNKYIVSYHISYHIIINNVATVIVILIIVSILSVVAFIQDVHMTQTLVSRVYTECFRGILPYIMVNVT